MVWNVCTLCWIFAMKWTLDGILDLRKLTSVKVCFYYHDNEASKCVCYFGVKQGLQGCCCGGRDWKSTKSVAVKSWWWQAIRTGQYATAPSMISTQVHKRQRDRQFPGSTPKPAWVSRVLFATARRAGGPFDPEGKCPGTCQCAVSLSSHYESVTTTTCDE